MQKIRSLAAALAAIALAACGGPDTRSFAVENAIFESLYLDSTPLAVAAETPERQARVAAGLAAICRGETAGARRLIRESAIGERIYPLLLIAAKARRDGPCDYSGWAGDKVLADRFKQLLNAGDAPTVLLAALTDRGLSKPDRLQVVKALADKRYSHGEAVYAGMLMTGEGTATDFVRARELLEDAARQGASPAHALLARLYREGLGTARDLDKACGHLRQAAGAGYDEAGRQLAELQAAGSCR